MDGLRIGAFSFITPFLKIEERVIQMLAGFCLGSDLRKKKKGYCWYAGAGDSISFKCMTNTWHMLATVCRITLFSTRLLRKAFEVFCNKGIAGTSSAELLAIFGDNILKKGGTEKLSAEAIEEILEKVVKLLAYVSDKDLFADFYR